MKTNARKVDGYAIQNTKHVLCALRVYLVRAAESSLGEAEDAAIGCYAALSQRRVNSRTVRRWLAVMKSYGSIEKTPENAFGALKSCPHVHRSFRAKLRQIEAETKRLAKEVSLNRIDVREAVELALIEKDLEAFTSRFHSNPTRRSLLTIRRLVRHLAAVPIRRLHQNITTCELEQTLEGFLTRLNTLARKSTGKARSGA